MALLFVAGVMNMWWVAVLSVLVMLEKVAPGGLLIGKIAGGLLIIWGVAMMLAFL
jgi:predicted metal-binding membrane protein